MSNSISGGPIYGAPIASIITRGVVKLSTDAETIAGTITNKVVTPAGISARMAEPGAIGGTTPAAGAFTVLKASINVETLAAAKTLVVTDYMAQWLNPNGVSRDVVLSAEASSTNLMFIILNTGTVTAFNLVIKNAAAVVKATLGPGMSGIFSCDGSSWKWENDTGVYYDAVNGFRGIGTTIPKGLIHVLASVGSIISEGSLRGDFFVIDNGAGADLKRIILRSQDGKLTIGGENDAVSIFRTSITILAGYGGTGNVGIGCVDPSVKLAIADDDTGFNLAAADSLSIVTGGVEGHRITEVAGVIGHVLTGIVKTPTTQTLTGAGAVDIVSAITHLVTAGVGDALTLADGAEGQMKTILTKTETTAGDTSVLTPTSFANGSTMTFDAPGDVAQLLFSNGAWHYTGGVGGVIG